MNDKIIDPKSKYGEFFQLKSKYIRNNLPNHRLDFNTKPDVYKEYKNADIIIDLPELKFNQNINFWEVIQKRHSTRKFTKDPFTLEEVGKILFGVSGLTRKFPRFAFRTVPSAGGLFPIENYIVVNNVADLEKGIYHYNIENHQLELLRKGDYRQKLAHACLDQKMVTKSALNIVWTAVIERSRWKYLQRCYRYIYMDCGHIGQNFYLVAEALGMGACTIGAIYDDEVNELLGIDGKEETAIYVGVLGKK